MTAPNEELIGPRSRPTDEELATMPTVRIPWQHPSRREPERPGAPLIVAALINTGLAALICITLMVGLVLLGRVTLGQTPNGTEVLIGVAGWLLAHGVPLQAGVGQIGLAPLTVALLAIWRLNRAGVHTSRGIGSRGSGSVLKAAQAALTIGAVYGVLGWVAATIVDRPGLGVDAWRSAAHLLVIGFFGGLIGSLRTTGAVRTIARAMPQVLRDAIRTGAVAAFMVLGAGAGLCGLAVALNGSEAVQYFRAFPSGLAGQIGVTMVCLAFAPNLATWSTAYLLGPGFFVGTDTVVHAGGVVIGENMLMLRPFPMLAALPAEPLSGPFWALMAVPVVLGTVAGVLLVRRRLRPRRTRSGDVVMPVPRWGRMLGSAALAGPVAGVVIGAMTLAANGRLDGGQPFPVGAVAWQTALAATVAVSLGAALGVVAILGRSWITTRS